MPSFVTHHYFAVRVRRAAPPAIACLCENAPAAYAWGSQGPDPFFFYPSTLSRLGGRMHRSGIAETFRAMADAAGESPAALAYLLGFCTHYARDRTVHPYIEDQTRRLSVNYRLSGSAAHKLCETDLDSAVLLRLGKAVPASEPAYRLLDTEAPECREAARLLSAAGNAAGGAVTAGQAKDALRCMYQVYRFLHRSRAGRRLLPMGEAALHQPGALSSMFRRNTLLPEDSPNRAHRIWLDWEGRPHTEDFRTLMERDALPFALVLQRAACAACRRGNPFPEGMFSMDYSGRRFGGAE